LENLPVCPWQRQLINNLIHKGFRQKTLADKQLAPYSKNYCELHALTFHTP